jgi:hypothetical protein
VTLACQECGETISCTCAPADGGHCLCADYTFVGDAVCWDCVAEADRKADQLGRMHDRATAVASRLVGEDLTK